LEDLRSVLIIDDDEDDQLLIQDRLEELASENCVFTSCREKADAIKYLKERNFDLCLLDYRLAGYEGIDVLEALTTENIATPIVMLTGQDDSGVATAALKKGAQDFVIKSSLNTETFNKSIQYAITRKELEFTRTISERTRAQNSAKDKFIAHLSHELRTPLTSILGYTSLLLDQPETSSFQNELNIISNNGKHLLSLLNDVLDLSKISANKFELKERKVSMQNLFSEVQSLISVSAIDKGLSLNIECLTQIPSHAFVDDVRLKQVLVNLLNNAVKFTDAGSIRVCITYEKMPNDKLIIEVIDTGIGMTAKQSSNIFSPFTQVEDVANRRAGGAGLGLSISSEIVKHMKGSLTVKSKLGEGSCFTLKIPCRHDNSEFLSLSFNTVEYESTEEKIPKLCGHILIVDDVEEIRSLAGFFVKQTGITVEYANNGQVAFDMLSKAHQQGKPYDLVLLDLHMPVLTGDDTIIAAREAGIKTTMLAMTAAIQKGLKPALLSIGFSDLLAKPLDKIELWTMLEKYLNQHGITNKEQDLEKIHLVEDDDDSAMVIQLILETLGCEVIRSDSASAAIENIKQHRDISKHLFDLNLPDGSGHELLSKVSAYKPTGRITILSGQQPDQTLLDEFAIAKHLLKPIDKDTLVDWLNEQN
jgi:signal transduction histidine kinase